MFLQNTEMEPNRFRRIRPACTYDAVLERLYLPVLNIKQLRNKDVANLIKYFKEQENEIIEPLTLTSNKGDDDRQRVVQTM